MIWQGICIFLCLFDAHLHLVTSAPNYAADLYTQGSQIQYETRYYQQPVDHFAFVKEDHFRQRFLYADQYWNPGKGPIFFYAGNEGDIAWFCNNTGIMWTWAQEFHALLIFGEHRYYGESMPYGNDSFKSAAHVGYLTSEQALADFAELLLHLKQIIPGAGGIPIIAFGGSYGGMLAAWFRIKYPHVVHGSLAASAPIWQFGNLVPTDIFNDIVTRDFDNAGPHCSDNIKRSWDVITELGSTDEGLHLLQSSLSLCNVTSADTIKSWLESVYGNLAMVEYPYPANFLQPLPAWPIKEGCKSLASPSFNDKELLVGISGLLNVYFNHTGHSRCFNSQEDATSDLGDLGWSYQACTEMVMPSSSSHTSMFMEKAWDLHNVSKDCQKKWRVTPRPNWILVEYGGKNITDSSNIIFSNGLLDPWSGGGVTHNLSDTLIAILIKDGAHHLDLRAPHSDDPDSVIEARNMEKSIITGWINDYYHSQGPELSMNIIKVHTTGSKFTGSEFSYHPRRSMTLILFAFLLLGLVGFAMSMNRKQERRQAPDSYVLLMDENVQP